MTCVSCDPKSRTAIVCGMSWVGKGEMKPSPIPGARTNWQERRAFILNAPLVVAEAWRVPEFARSPRGLQRFQPSFDLLPSRLEERRQGQVLSQRFDRLVGREAGTIRGDLKQNPIRLAEIKA